MNIIHQQVAAILVFTKYLYICRYNIYIYVYIYMSIVINNYPLLSSIIYPLYIHCYQLLSLIIQYYISSIIYPLLSIVINYYPLLSSIIYPLLSTIIRLLSIIVHYCPLLSTTSMIINSYPLSGPLQCFEW